MSKEIRLKKGLNINLAGGADKVYASLKPEHIGKKYVLKPTDFHTLTPKLFSSFLNRIPHVKTLYVNFENFHPNNTMTS